LAPSLFFLLETFSARRIRTDARISGNLLRGKKQMTWIRTIPLAEADERLRKAIEAQRGLYPREYATPVHDTGDGTSDIVASHSLIPDALYHAFATFGVLMSPELPLERRHHEMIATVVSANNRCVY
jgi:hypothetical protein